MSACVLVGVVNTYGVASTSRLLQIIIGLFCKRALYKRRYSAKETCDFKELTNFSHPIAVALWLCANTQPRTHSHEHIATNT